MWKECLICLFLLTLTSSCLCGRGGLCVGGDIPCLCEYISTGIFVAEPFNCNTLVQHCTANSCLNGGTCYESYGSHICDCPKGWSGSHCQYHTTSTSAHIHFWYPIQGESWHRSVYVGGQLGPNSTLKVRTKHFVWTWSVASLSPVTKDEVIQKCGIGPDCDLIAKFSRPSAYAKFDVVFPVSFKDHVVIADGHPVGTYDDVELVILDKVTQHNTTYRFYNDYGPMRICTFTVQFSGCAQTPFSAPIYTTSNHIVLKVTTNFSILTRFQASTKCLVKRRHYAWKSGSITLGHGENIEMLPLDFGMPLGLQAVVVTAEFRDIIGVQDIIVPLVCYFRLKARVLKVVVAGFGRVYKCSTPILLKAQLWYPDYKHLRYLWSCRYCSGAVTDSDLLIDPFPCGRTLIVTVEVQDMISHRVSKSSGILGTSFSPYNLDLTCAPSCSDLNPYSRVTVAAETSIESTLIWSSLDINQTLVQDSRSTSNFFLIRPRVLEFNRTYRFKVETQLKSVVFTVKTVPRLNLSCILRPTTGIKYVTEFSLSCSSSPFRVLENGDVIAVSLSTYTSGIRLTQDMVSVRTNTASIELKVSLASRSWTPKWFLGEVAAVDNHIGIDLVLRIDALTRLDANLSYAVKFRLMRALALVPCPWPLCSHLKVNAVRRLCQNAAPNNSKNVDMYILRAGYALCSVTRDWTGAELDLDFFTGVLSAFSALIRFRDPLLHVTHVEPEIRLIHYRKVQKGNKLARNAVEKMGLLITKNVPYPSVPVEIKSSISSEVFLVSPNHPKYINQVIRRSSGSYFQFTNSAFHQMNNSISVGILFYGVSSFWWSTANTGEIIEVFLYEFRSQMGWSIVEYPLIGPSLALIKIPQTGSSDSKGPASCSQVQCVVLSGAQWSNTSCRWVVKIGNSSTVWVECLSDYLSLHTAAVKTYKRQKIHAVINFVVDVVNNWYVPSFLLAIYAVFIAILFRGIVKDRQNEASKTIEYLRDNYPKEEHPYLIGVYTGSRCLSGTSAHVALRIVGETASSRVHILNVTRPMKKGLDNWFYLYTKEWLGPIQGIVMWHDGYGHNPDWYCARVVVFDIVTRSRVEFDVQAWLFSDTVLSVNRTENILKWSIRVRNQMSLSNRRNLAARCVSHPRNVHTQAEGAILWFEVTLVAVLVSMRFYSGLNPGLVDNPSVKFYMENVKISFYTMLYSACLTLPSTLLFNLSKKQTLRELNCVSKAIDWHSFQSVLTYLLTPPRYMPVMTLSQYKACRHKFNPLNFMAWTFSVLVITGSSLYIIIRGVKFGKRLSLTWFVTFLMARLSHTLFLEPALLLLTTFIVAFILRKGADTTQILVEADYTEPERDVHKRLDMALNTRTLQMYKPPVTGTVPSRSLIPPAILNAVTMALLSSSVIVLVIFLDITENHYRIRDINSQLKSDSKVHLRTQYYDFLRDKVVVRLHKLKWYNGQPLPLEKYELDRLQWNIARNISLGDSPVRGFGSDYVTKIMGVPSIRQKRVAESWSVRTPAEFKIYYSRVLGPLNSLSEDDEDYLPQWLAPTPYSLKTSEMIFRSADETETGYFAGQTGTFYAGSGYVQTLYYTLPRSKAKITELQLDDWIDNGTRVMFFNYNLYNAFIDRVTAVVIITEFLASGVIVSRLSIEAASFPFVLTTDENVVALILSFIAALLILHFSRFLILASKEGLLTYFLTWAGVNDVALLMSGFGLVFNMGYRFFYFFWAVERIERAARDESISLYNQFFLNFVGLLFSGVFCVFVSAFSAILVTQELGCLYFKLAWSHSCSVILFMIAMTTVYTVLATTSLHHNLYTFLILLPKTEVKFHPPQIHTFVVCLAVLSQLFNVSAFIFFYLTVTRRVSPVPPVMTKKKMFIGRKDTRMEIARTPLPHIKKRKSIAITKPKTKIKADGKI